MKTRIFSLVLMLMFAITMDAQTYSQLWKNVEQMEQKDMPKSVIAEAEKIYEKAKQERNVPQMMKAYLTMMTYRGNITPDSIPVDIKGLEEWAEASSTQVQDRAVLYSILGGICIRDDFEKGNRYLHLSLKDSLKLVDYSTKIKNVKITGCADVYADKCTRYANDIGAIYKEMGMESDIKIIRGMFPSSSCGDPPTV